MGRFKNNKLILRITFILTLSVTAIYGLYPIVKQFKLEQLSMAGDLKTKTFEIGSMSADLYKYNDMEIGFDTNMAKKKVVNSPIIFDAENGDITDYFDIRKNDPAADDPSVVEDSTDKVYRANGHAEFVSHDIIPINPNQSHKISGKFKAVGTQPSRVYLGLIPYISNSESYQQRAFRRLYLAKGNVATVVSINNNSVVVTEDDSLSTWNLATDYGYNKSIGFYFDGDTNKLPDHVMNSKTNENLRGTSYGVYRDIYNKTVSLNIAIPDGIKNKIVPGITKIRNHWDAGTYMYAAADNVYLSLGIIYQTFEGTASGINTDFTYDNVRFPPETQWVGVVIIVNYTQGSLSQVQFDDIKLESSSGVFNYNHHPMIELKQSHDFVGLPKSLECDNNIGCQNVGFQVSIDDGKTWMYYDDVTSQWQESKNIETITSSYDNTAYNYIRTPNYVPRHNNLAKINANLSKLVKVKIDNSESYTEEEATTRFKFRAFLLDESSKLSTISLKYDDYVGTPEAPIDLVGRPVLDKNGQLGAFRLKFDASRLHGAQLSSGNGFSPIEDYIIQYCRANAEGLGCDFSWETHDRSLSHLIALDTIEYDISGLGATGEKYLFRVAAKNAIGVGEWAELNNKHQGV